MDLSSIPQLTQAVLIASAVIGLLFGAIAHRTHFCTMGAVSDIVNMDDWTRMRQWGLAVGVAMLGVGVLSYSGTVDFSKTLYASTRWLWLSALVGGLMFGLGMVLASGCGNKTLVRIGAGSLKSIVVFLAMGVSAFATLKGITAVARVATVDRVAVDFTTPATLPGVLAGVLGVPQGTLAFACGALLGLALIFWALRDRDFRSAGNFVAGFGLGGLVVVAWWVSGHFGFIAEHPETLQEAFVATNSGRAEALSFVAPMAHTLDWLLFFSDKSKVLSIGVVALIGVIVGSFVSARLDGSFRWEGFGSPEDVANHLVGGALMGIGGVTAMGCTVGQGLSGVSTLSLTSFVAVLGIVLGAVAALRYQVWRMEHMV
jgi:uncharacterized protein